MSGEHLAGAVIRRIFVTDRACELGYEPEGWCVGHDGITRIEAFVKPGLHSDIPYVRVWKGDKPVAEYWQHNIIGVYFAAEAGDAP